MCDGFILYSKDEFIGKVDIYEELVLLKNRVMELLKSHRIYPIMKDLNTPTDFVH